MPLASLLPALLLVAQSQPSAKPAPSAKPTATFEELQLTLTLPALAGFEGKTKLTSEKWGEWRGRLGGSDVVIGLRVFPRGEVEIDSPEAVLGILGEIKHDPERGGDPNFSFEHTERVVGPFGVSRVAEIRRGSVETPKEGVPFQGLFLGSILPKYGYTVEVYTTPPLQGKAADPLVEFLKKGIVYKGAVENPNWTDEEARARWRRDAPADAKEKLEPILRTKHFLILTNSSGGASFAKKMEECYEAIQKTFPFEEPVNARLLPVFLFRNPEQYYEYYAKVANISRDQAAKSKGHAYRDYYATWYESPGDPVHIHEATHQIFMNRLHLWGGGSWFQEGVAEYMSTKPNDRNEAARLVKKEQHVRLAEFVVIPSLLYSANGGDKRGGNTAGDHYKQAALLIEFLRDGPLKAKFPEFLKTIGRTFRGSKDAIDKAVKQIYGFDLATLDKKFVEYCQSR